MKYRNGIKFRKKGLKNDSEVNELVIFEMWYL